MEQLIVRDVDLTKFLGIPYAGPRHPNSTSVENFCNDKTRGANCELFALAVWHEAGFYTQQKRSIELWHDDSFTVEVEEPPYEPFDIFLFLPKGIDPHKLAEEIREFEGFSEDVSELKRFHQAVYTPSDESPTIPLFLHLAKPGPSSIWRFEEFEESDKEYWLFKVKRPTCRIEH